MRSIVHPRLLDRLAPSYFPSRVTIQAKMPTRTGTGAEVPGWAAVAGLANIPASIAPRSAEERRASSLTVAEATHTCVLAGAFPTITPQHRALGGGDAYEIVGVELDSQAVMTRLGLRAVTI